MSADIHQEACFLLVLAADVLREKVSGWPWRHPCPASFRDSEKDGGRWEGARGTLKGTSFLHGASMAFLKPAGQSKDGAPLLFTLS